MTVGNRLINLLSIRKDVNDSSLEPVMLNVVDHFKKGYSRETMEQEKATCSEAVEEKYCQKPKNRASEISKYPILNAESLKASLR